MRGRHLLTVAAVIFVAVAAVTHGSSVSAANQNPSQNPPGQGGGRGRGGGGFADAFPPRSPGDPAAIERGRTLYGVHCTFCHGADTRGGDGGPSLLRSQIVLEDRGGELIAPVVKNGRVDRGMPKFALTDDQIADVAAFIHSFRAAGYDESR